ncbi:unnamed protein product [Penicillium glandicola]
MLSGLVHSTIYDALIIGGGPAGLSAALTLGRVNRSALVFDSGIYRNEGAAAMHTVISRDGTPPNEFRRISRQQIEEKYTTISFRDLKVVQATKTDIGGGYMGFQATDETQQAFLGRRIIMATGSEDILPTDIEGYRENWPEHIYQCPTCDGFEQRNHPIGILKFDSPAYLHLSFILMNFNTNITIFTDGIVPEDPEIQKAIKTVLSIPGTSLETRKIKRLVNNGPGPENGVTIEFEEGPSQRLGMIIHKPRTRSFGKPLFDQLGVDVNEMTGDAVVANQMFLESTVPGCILAGDTIEMIKQVAIAQGAGVRAGSVVNMQLTKEAIDKASASL